MLRFANSGQFAFNRPFTYFDGWIISGDTVRVAVHTSPPSHNSRCLLAVLSLSAIGYNKLGVGLHDHIISKQKLRRSSADNIGCILKEHAVKRLPAVPRMNILKLSAHLVFPAAVTLRCYRYSDSDSMCLREQAQHVVVLKTWRCVVGKVSSVPQPVCRLLIIALLEVPKRMTEQ